MEPATRRLIEALHLARYRYVLALTGGGSGAVALLLTVPGGSRTVLESVIPYSEQALAEYLGYQPDQFCAMETAVALAERARTQAERLVPGAEVAGIGCTASLATDRPKRGDHRFHAAVCTAQHTFRCSLTLTKGARDRAGEEIVLDSVLLNLMAEAFEVALRMDVSLLPGEIIQQECLPSSDALAIFLRGEPPTICIEADGRVSQDVQPRLLLPGAFNPVHEGHWQLAEMASRLLNVPAAFELSVTNVDKPPLAFADLRRRLAQFAWRAPVWLTRAPTFIEKSLLFPGTVFAIGVDTAERIIAPRYYQDSPERMKEALATIRRQGCRFLVAGRSDAAGCFTELHTLDLPVVYRDLFTPIDRDLFRVDISSTEIRSRCQGSCGGGPPGLPGIGPGRPGGPPPQDL